MTNKYSFDETKHCHTLDGIPLYGVTTVLSVISKPALVAWAAKMVVDNIKEHAPLNHDEELGNDYYYVTLERLEEAKNAHRTKKEVAGNWGTEVHQGIENYIKGKGDPVFVQDKQQTVFDKLKDWAKENNVEFLESEKHVWSKDLWIGGILDLKIKMNGKIYLADIKTSSGIYKEAFYQIGAYHLCLQEMGDKDEILGYLVINLKKDGKIDTKLVEDTETNKEAFKYALGLYKIINKQK